MSENGIITLVLALGYPVFMYLYNRLLKDFRAEIQKINEQAAKERRELYELSHAETADDILRLRMNKSDDNTNLPKITPEEQSIIDAWNSVGNVDVKDIDNEITY